MITMINTIATIATNVNTTPLTKAELLSDEIIGSSWTITDGIT